MNALGRMGRKLMLAACVVGLSATVGQAAMLYELKFDGQTLANTGTKGGAATVNSYTTGGNTFNPTFATDTFNSTGNSIELPRSASTYRGPSLSLPDSTNAFRMQSGNDMTIAMWVKRNAQGTTTTRQQGLVSTQVGTGNGSSGWSLYLEEVGTGTVGTRGARLVFDNFVPDAGVGSRQRRAFSDNTTGNTSPIVNVNVDEWTHVAVSIDQGSSITFYVNGQVTGGVQGHFNALNAVGVSLANSQAVRVGPMYQSTATDSGPNQGIYPTFGKQDNVQLFDTALSATEIADLMVAVPEPSSLALAAVGGLMLLRRRREALA